MNSFGLGILDYIVMGGFFVSVIFIGLWFSRKEKTSEDYLLGGRKIPWMAAGISLMMALFSTYSLVMVPGEVFNNSMSMFTLSLLSPIFLVLSFFIFMRFYFRLGSFTPFEYIQRRYDYKVRFLIAMIYLWTRLIYLSMVLFTTSKVFEGAAGWPAWFTILLIGTIGILYTTMGGIKAVIWNDVIQFGVMTVGMSIAIYILCSKVEGGFPGIISYALKHGKGPVTFAEANFYKVTPYTRLSFWLLFWGLIQNAIFSTSADQITIQRLLTTSSYRNAFKANLTNSIISIPISLALIFIGFAIFSYYSQHPDPRVTSGDTAFFTFIGTQLPSPLPGLILAGMLAAAMSTLDSGMNSLSTIWVKEFYQLYIRKNATEKQQVKISRGTTFLVGIFIMAVGMIIATTAETIGQTVVEAATVFWAFSVVIMPAYLFAVFSKRANAKMIWVLAMFCWGLNLGVDTWYLCTKSQDSPFRTPMPIVIAIIPLGIGLFGILCSINLKKFVKKIGMALMYLSLLITGYGTGMGLWYTVSNLSSGGDDHYSLSFLWAGLPGIVTFLVAGIIWLAFFSKDQPEEKYMGLTMSTMNSKIMQEKQNVESLKFQS